MQQRFAARLGPELFAPFDAAAVDLHYLASGTVSGTVILLKSAGWTEAEIPKLLKSLDDDFLPDVDLERGTLTYTVVLGELIGVFEAEASGEDVAH